MKLGKDEIQKIALSSVLLLGLLYCYFALMLSPLGRREKAAEDGIKALQPKLEAASKQIRRTSELETQAPAVNETQDQIKALIPEGAPVAWFPPRLADFFKRQGIEKCSTRLNNEFPEKDLPGFRKLVWSVELPKVKFATFGIAIAGLENEQPLVEINNVQIEAIKGDPQYQHAVLTVSTIVKQ